MASSNRGNLVSVDAAGALTGDGSTGNPLAVGVDGVTVTIVNDVLVAPTGGGGTIGGNLGGTDNVVPRSNGTGGATLQASAVSIGDTGIVTATNTVSVGTGVTGSTFDFLSAAGNGFVALNKNFSTVTDDGVQFYQGSSGDGAMVNQNFLQGIYFSQSADNMQIDCSGAGQCVALTGATLLAPDMGAQARAGFSDPARRLYSELIYDNTKSTTFNYSNLFYTQFKQTTDVNPEDGISLLASYGDYGTAAVAPIGSLTLMNATLIVANNGDTSNEHAPMFSAIRYDIGPDYPITAGPTGNGWLFDYSMHGPIAVQPGKLSAGHIVLNEYYNGSPLNGVAGAMWLVTGKGLGGGNDSTHGNASTYPVDVGLGIVGTSNAGSDAIGFTTAIQIGGSGSNWEVASSKIGTGVDIRDYATAAINIHNAGATTAPSLIFDTFLQTAEMGSAPSAPSANGVRIYAVDNGGKTELLALFASGAAQRIAIQP